MNNYQGDPTTLPSRDVIVYFYLKSHNLMIFKPDLLTDGCVCNTIFVYLRKFHLFRTEIYENRVKFCVSRTSGTICRRANVEGHTFNTVMYRT
jgi:hypothetical protein